MFTYSENLRVHHRHHWNSTVQRLLRPLPHLHRPHYYLHLHLHRRHLCLNRDLENKWWNKSWIQAYSKEVAKSNGDSLNYLAGILSLRL